MKNPATAAGAELGVAFPTTIEPLLEMGPAFLTEAFRATGAFGGDNAVAEVVASEEFYGGGMGRKLRLDVRYARPQADLHEQLFVKLPRMFGDPLRDLFSPLMQPEVRFALLSRRENFPLTVPKCYFADYDPETKSGILITECIPYGENGVEPCHDKCADYELAEPLAYYQALTKAMARLAGAHKSGGLGPSLDAQFPFDPAVIEPGSRIPFDAGGLNEKLETLQTFAADMPGLFPDNLGSPSFLEAFAADARTVLTKELAIRNHLNAAEDLIALCHWNMNVDNAWFWRDADGALQVGLLDWGAVSQMNLAQAFYGMTCAAETDFLNTHRDDLIKLLVTEYNAHSGPHIDPRNFLNMYKLAVGVLGVAWMLDAPAIIAREIPDYRAIRDRFDPALRDNFLARAQMQILVILLNEWRALDVGGAIRDF